MALASVGFSEIAYSCARGEEHHHSVYGTPEALAVCRKSMMSTPAVSSGSNWDTDEMQDWDKDAAHHEAEKKALKKHQKKEGKLLTEHQKEEKKLLTEHQKEEGTSKAHHKAENKALKQHQKQERRWLEKHGHC